MDGIRSHRPGNQQRPSFSRYVRRLVTLAGLGLLLASGCGPEQTLLLVSLRGVSSTVAKVGIGVVMAGMPSDNPQILSGRPQRIGIWLAGSLRGTAEVVVLTWDSRGCKVSVGTEEVNVEATGTYQTTVVLADVPSGCS